MTPEQRAAAVAAREAQKLENLKISRQQKLAALGAGAKAIGWTGAQTANLAYSTGVPAAGFLAGTAAGAALFSAEAGYRLGSGALKLGRMAMDPLGTLRGKPTQLFSLNKENFGPTAALKRRVLGMGALAIAGSTVFQSGRVRQSMFQTEVSPNGRLEIARPESLGATGDIVLNQNLKQQMLRQAMYAA